MQAKEQGEPRGGWGWGQGWLCLQTSKGQQPDELGQLVPVAGPKGTWLTIFQLHWT